MQYRQLASIVSSPQWEIAWRVRFVASLVSNIKKYTRTKMGYLLGGKQTGPKWGKKDSMHNWWHWWTRSFGVQIVEDNYGPSWVDVLRKVSWWGDGDADSMIFFASRIQTHKTHEPINTTVCWLLPTLAFPAVWPARRLLLPTPTIPLQCRGSTSFNTIQTWTKWMVRYCEALVEAAHFLDTHAQRYKNVRAKIESGM